jgi:hypothetical protein
VAPEQLFQSIRQGGEHAPKNPPRNPS